jgi:hypothetical protein
VTKVVQLYNRGRSPVVITKTLTSCGCTTVGQIAKEILPGSKAQVTVQFDSHGKYGQIDKSVFLFVAGESKPVQISLTGETYVETKFSPSVLNFGQLKVGDFRTSQVSFRRSDGRPLRIIKVQSSNDLRTVITNQDSGNALLSVTLNADHTARPISENVSVYTDDATLPKVDIHTYGNVIGEYNASPDVINFGEVALGKATTQSIVIRGPSVNKLQIESMPAYIKAGFTNKQNDRESTVVLTLNPDRITGKVLNSKLVISTQNREQPTLTFLILAAVSDSK